MHETFSTTDARAESISLDIHLFIRVKGQVMSEGATREGIDWGGWGLTMEQGPGAGHPGGGKQGHRQEWGGRLVPLDGFAGRRLHKFSPVQLFCHNLELTCVLESVVNEHPVLKISAKLG